MTKNEKIAAALGGTLVVAFGLIAFNTSKSQTPPVVTSPIAPAGQLAPLSTNTIPMALPAPAVKGPTYMPTASGLMPVMAPAATSNSNSSYGYVRTPSGSLAKVPLLRSEQPGLAPGGSAPVQPGIDEPMSAPPVVEHTTAFVPESTTVHRVYVHRRIGHRSSGKIHVARAVKHTVAFAVKMPGRLRL